jgi:hypothetical protein
VAFAAARERRRRRGRGGGFVRKQAKLRPEAVHRLSRVDERRQRACQKQRSGGNGTVQVVLKATRIEIC